MTITTRKFTTVVAGFAMVAALAFSLSVPAAHAALTESQIQSILSLLSSFGADQSTINNVNASLRGQPTTSTPSTPSTPSSCAAFTRDLTVGSTGSDVMELQKILNANGYPVAASGAGSPGNESTYFGSLTQAALAKWQASVGISPAAGYFGPITRAKLAGSCTTNPNVPSTPVPGTGLSVSAGSQPQNALAPTGAQRVPFTRVVLTASNNGPVIVNSLVVQRTGLGSNAPFAGVVLVDESTGMQLGTAKTFNSNDQATIGEPITIPAGQSRTFLVGGNMGSSLGSYAGQVPAISVVGVNTSASVSGSLPITGAYHTINATLTVGTMSLDLSNAFSTNANATKEIGTTAYKTTGFRLTAGSAEDVRLMSVRFNQTGSASTVTDLANVKVVVEGTAYPATVSSDGKYISATLGSGILIAEGNSVEVYVQYDIVGTNSNSRTVIFDVDKTTDIFATGVTYGYGISPAAGSSAPSGTRSVLEETSGTPYLYASQVTISGASVTTIGKANSIAAQNIAPNLANQPLGGFETDLKGEAITVQSMVFTVATSASIGGPLTNVTIVNENGSIVAGPVDASSAGSSLTFSDSVTFPTGKHTYTIRGKVASDPTNGATIILSTTPSSGWTNVKGDLTGNTITLTQGAFSMNTMTVKTASLAIGRAASPASQTIVAGGTDVLFVNLQLDATQSGEDVRLSSFPFSLTFGGTSVDTDLSSCRLFDGATALNTGSNVINPGDASATTSAYTGTATFDNSITVAKGTVKTLGMKCNVSGSATSGGTYAWDHGTIGSFSATGAVSGNSITETASSDTAVTVTVGSGTVTITTDASSPGFMLSASGATDVPVGAYRFTTTNESVNLQKVGLTLSNTASSSSGDLVKVSLYDGATKVGEAYFTGSNTSATSTLTQLVTVPKNGDKTLTVKADFANIGISEAVTFSGHLVAINYLNAEGVGAESGSTVTLGAAAGSTSVAGTRVFRSYPTVALDTLSSSGVADGRLMRFKVSANASGPVSLTSFALDIATSSGVAVQNVTIYGYTDANYSLPISGVSSDGNLQTTLDCLSNSCTTGVDVAVEIVNGSGTATTIQVPAGQTRYFEARASVSGIVSGSSITTTLQGDSSFPSTAAGVGSNPLLVAASAGTASTDFIWSPNSTTTVVRASQDWTNGFGVSGLPSSGLIQTRSQ